MKAFVNFSIESPAAGARQPRRKWALAFVEGYQGADARLISAQSTGGDEDPSGDPEAQLTGRIVDGYDCVTEALSEPISASISTSAIVTGIRWTRGAVEIESQTAAGRSRPAGSRATRHHHRTAWSAESIARGAGKHRVHSAARGEGCCPRTDGHGYGRAARAALQGEILDRQGHRRGGLAAHRSKRCRSCRPTTVTSRCGGRSIRCARRSWLAGAAVPVLGSSIG